MSKRVRLRIAPFVLLAVMAIPLRAEPLTLVRDGATGYALVVSAESTAAETYAAEELTNFVHRATGVLLPVVDESAHAGGPAIHLGWTAFAAGQGIDGESLGQEEWVIRAADGNLILTGGRPRGTLYAVYEFLETQLGVHFLDAHTEHVPDVGALEIPADLDIRGAPAFSRREVHRWGWAGPPEWVRFQVRRKLNSFANAWHMPAAKYGHAVKYGSPYTTHTTPRYLKDFPEAFGQEAYFALTARGNRVSNEVCMSHPDVRGIFAEKLREYIRRDRQAILDAGRDVPYPVYYALIPHDCTSSKCVCERCHALAEKHHSYAGVVLDFANAIADDIVGDFPEIVLVTSAYTYYREVPQNIRPHDNVMVKIAQLGAEFTTTRPRRDTLRGMLHPLNQAVRREWEGWSAISPRLAVHDYWTAWAQSHYWPQANVRGLAETLKFYHRQGLKHFFTESPLVSARVHNFVDLQFYLATRLFQDPEQDAGPIVDRFMDLYYGPAAPHMQRLLDYLERRQEEETTYLTAVPPSARAYFDAAFFIETDALLREAEHAVSGKPAVLANVRQERLAIDEAMLYLWNRLERDAPEQWPLDREKVLERLEINYAYVHAKYGGRPPDSLRLEYLRNMPAIPAQFEGKNIIDLCGQSLRLALPSRMPKRTDDPDAATGTTWRLDTHTWSENDLADHAAPPKFGLFLAEPRFLLERVLSIEEIPRDEKYHWHFVGRMQASPNMYFFAHQSWIFDKRLFMAYNAALPEQKHYDVYVSLKLEGPAYVPGSERENAFSIDRLILVEVEPE